MHIFGVGYENRTVFTGQNLLRCNQRLSLLTIQIPALKMDKKFDFSTIYVDIFVLLWYNEIIRIQGNSP
jgi:hypothetical protein